MVEEIFDFVVVKKSDLFANDVGELDEGGVERFDVAFGEIFEKAAESNEVIRLGDGFEIFAVTIFFAIKLEAKLADKFLSDVGGGEIVAFAGNIAGKVEKTGEVALIVFGSFARTATLDFEVFDKVRNKFGERLGSHKRIIAWYNKEMEQEQSQEKKLKTDLDKIRRGSRMLMVGIVGLVILALLTLHTAIEMTQVSVETRSMNYWPILMLPVYFMLGGVLLIYSTRASSFYKKDLRVVSGAYLMGLVLAFLGQFLWVGMIFAWLIYYGLLFWWLTRRSKERARYLIYAEQAWAEQNSGNENAGNNRARRAAKVSIVVAVVSFLVPTLIIGGLVIEVISSPHLDTAMVRERFEKSAYARSSYFTIIEKEMEKAKDDRIYLQIDGLQKEVRYDCDASFNLVYVGCKVVIGDEKDGRGESLSMYFWNLHQDEISMILEKYGEVLDYRVVCQNCKGGGSVEIDVYKYNETAATEFVKDLLEISDIRKLYLAYQAEVNQSSEMNASEAFGNFDLNFYEGEDRSRFVGRYPLFKFAQERGI